MLEREREAVGVVRATPGLLLGGAGAAAILVLAGIVGTYVVSSVPVDQNVPLVVVPVVAGVIVLGVPIPFAGIVGVAREALAEGSADETGGELRRWPLGRLVRTSVVTGPTLFAGSLVGWVVALVLAIPVFLVLLSVETGVTYARYAHGLDQAPSVWQKLLVFLGLVLLAVAVARLPLSFSGIRSLDRSPKYGLVDSLRFARRRPRRLVRYGLGQFLLVSPAVLAPVLFVRTVNFLSVSRVLDLLPGLLEALLVVTFLIAGLLTIPLAVIVSATLASVYRVIWYEREVRPWLEQSGGPTAEQSGRPLTPSLSRRQLFAIVAVVVLLTAAVSGALAVRTNDVRPDQSPGPMAVDEDEDPEAILATARTQVRTTNHEQHARHEMGEVGDTEPFFDVISVVDYRDRQYRATITAWPDDDEWYSDPVTFYGSDRTFAIAFSSDGSPAWLPVGLTTVQSPFTRTSENWGIIAVPGYEPLLDDELVQPDEPPEKPNWTVTERTDERVVVEWVERPALPDEPAGSHVVEERVEVVVETDTGRPVRLVETRLEEQYDDDHELGARNLDRTTVEYDEWETADAERPDEIGSPNLLERLWGVIYY